MNETTDIPNPSRLEAPGQRKEQPFKFRRVNELTGTLIILVVAALIAAVVWTGHSQRWFKSRVPLRIILPEAGAAGIRQGSEVYFLGTLVGSVSDVVVDEKGRMEAKANIRHDFFLFVRADSSAVVKKKFGVAGDSFFEITRGQGQPLPENNASIDCKEQFLSALEAAVEEVRREAMLVLKKTTAGLDTWTQLGEGLSETREHLDQLTVRLANMTAGVEQGKGTVGKLLTDTSLVDDARKLLGRLENMAAGVEAGKGTVGKLITDTTLADEAQKLLVRANLAMGELQGVMTNLNAAVKNIHTGTERLPEITDAVANEAKNLPGLVEQTQNSMIELERLIEAIQRHWLLRKYVNPTNPPSLRPLEPPKQAVKARRTAKDSTKQP
jgi:phospholipid/cholesterol/gamma-HCH transport system substrate-binding protein